MKILHFASIRLAPWFISGILFGFYTDFPWYLPLVIIIAFLLLLILFHSRLKWYFWAFPLKRALHCFKGRAFRSYSSLRCGVSAAIPNAALQSGNRPDKKTITAIRPIVSGSFVFIAVFLIGWLSMSFHKGKNQPSHYTNHIQPNVEHHISFQIRKVLKPTTFYDRYEVQLLRTNTKKVSGKALLNVQKDTATFPIRIDDRYTTKTTLKAPTLPLNPHQFKYKAYLEKQNIHHQLYVSPKTLYKQPPSSLPSLYAIAASLRQKTNDALRQQGFKGDELAVINALLLGQRQDISNEVYTSYTRAGAIHILAVSGLHVGILLLMLHFLFRPLEYVKHGKPLKLLLVILLLWAFAIIAGLSASVVRAVTMFSFVAWALQLKRTTNIYNILAISLCFLLLVKPSFLFDVGFQLSYSAVFAIVWIQPLLYKLWKPPFTIINFFWKILTVTLAAQAGVLPLSLYYFHQFPGLFFMTNLVLIPILGIILSIGVLSIVLSLLGQLPSFLATAYAFVIRLMNGFIQWVAQQEAFLIKDIPFDGTLLLTAYLMLISGILMLKKPVFSRIFSFLMAIVFLQTALIFNTYTTEHTRRFIVFHKNRATVIGEQDGSTMRLYTSDENVLNTGMLTNYTIGERVEQVTKEATKNSYVFNKKVIFIIDRQGIYQLPKLQPDYVLLSGSPKINLERLITTLNPKVVIADGSSYKSDIQRWKRTCTTQKIPFHATGEKGAFILEW
ncbi:MAG: ComEC/Rec2 family competence protein, partial [Bacteroidota bacterium]